MLSPTLWIVAGPNGAGKTTCTQRHPITTLLPGVRFLNPDDLSREKLLRQGYSGFADAPDDVRRSAFLESADEVFDELSRSISAGEAVGVETVLSTDKYRTVVEAVRQAGGFVGLIYVALESAALACQRVAARVRRGGHDVPVDKVEARWERSLDNLAWFARQATAFWIFDNSDSNLSLPMLLAARGRFGAVEFLAEDIFPRLRSAVDKVHDA
jgi:predicted ABC-type ATPase